MGIENEYEEKTILVTGGAGCTGTNLCRKLAELGARKVIILDDLSSAYEWNIPKAKNEEHCIRKARLRLPFGSSFRKPMMVGLGRELQGCLCTGWDVIEIENPDNFYCGLEEIAASNF